MADVLAIISGGMLSDIDDAVFPIESDVRLNIVYGPDGNDSTGSLDLTPVPTYPVNPMINTYCKESVVIHVDQGKDEWNTPIATADEIIKARVIERTSVIKNLEGEFIQSEVQLLLAPRTIQALDEFTVRGVKRPVVKWAKPSSWTNLFAKVWLQ